MVNVDALVDTSRGLLSPEIYTSEELYRQELEQVFARTWLFLAHESQLPKRGSFVQAYMAEDPVMVVRQKDGSVKAFLNQCGHRGMRICRSDVGEAKTFTCTYHGWAYDLEGNLINVPQEGRGYRNELDKEKWGAIKVPRIAEYKGFYFGTWDMEIPEFEEYLGDFKFFFDTHFDRWDDGFEVVGPVMRWVIDANWKFAAEQFASDMYHAPVSHASSQLALTDDSTLQTQRVNRNPFIPGRQFGGNGHGTGAFWIDEFPDPNGNSEPLQMQWQREHRDEVFRNIGEERALKAQGHSTVFPSFSYLGNGTMRVWHPRGPGQIEVWAWIAVPKGAPDEVKAAFQRSVQRTFSPAGSFETDDGENWPEIQSVMRGWKARNRFFNGAMGLGHEERDTRGLPGLTNDVFSEHASRGFYRRWADLMNGRSWAEIKELDQLRYETHDVVSEESEVALAKEGGWGA